MHLSSAAISTPPTPPPTHPKKKKLLRKLQRAAGAGPMMVGVLLKKQISLFQKSASDPKILLRAGLELIPNPVKKVGPLDDD